MQPIQDRFWAKVDKTDGCWNWTGAKHAKGYGHFNVDGRVVKAHRWSYEQMFGAIPPGLTIDHLCRNTACVRPDHLEVVDGRTNTLRGYNPCAINARKTHCPQGHQLTNENVYIRPGTRSRRCRTCWYAQARGTRGGKNVADLGSGS